MAYEKGTSFFKWKHTTKGWKAVKPPGQNRITMDNHLHSIYQTLLIRNIPKIPQMGGRTPMGQLRVILAGQQPQPRGPGCNHNSHDWHSPHAHACNTSPARGGGRDDGTTLGVMGDPLRNSCVTYRNQHLSAFSPGKSSINYYQRGILPG